MKIINSKKAVTEILGTFILLMISIALFSLVNFVVITYPFSEGISSVNLIGFIDTADLTDPNDDMIIIKHNYGDKLDLETEIILKIGSKNHYLTANYDTTLDTGTGPGVGYWSIGESFKIDPANPDPVWLASHPESELPDDIAGKYVGITVVDIESNSVIMMANLQKGTT